MRVVLMSDSHDNLPALQRAVDFCNQQQADEVLHAGDLVAPFVSRVLKNLLAPLTIVFGNNDGERNGLRQVFREKIFEPPHEIVLDGRKVLMLHDPILLDALAASKRYDLILHGHIHEIKIVKQPTLIVNPGEVGGWLTGKSTVAVWDTQSDKVEIIKV